MSSMNPLFISRDDLVLLRSRWGWLFAAGIALFGGRAVSADQYPRGDRGLHLLRRHDDASRRGHSHCLRIPGEAMGTGPRLGAGRRALCCRRARRVLQSPAGFERPDASVRIEHPWRRRVPCRRWHRPTSDGRLGMACGDGHSHHRRGGIVLAGWPVNSLWLIGALLAFDLVFHGLALAVFAVALKRKVPESSTNLG